MGQSRQAISRRIRGRLTGLAPRPHPAGVLPRAAPTGHPVLARRDLVLRPAPAGAAAVAARAWQLPATITDPAAQGKGRSMRPVIGFFLLCWSVAAHAQQPYFQPPTATELFDLRSRCAALGDKFLDDLLVGPHIRKSITSHYDPRTNHCYGDLVTQNIVGHSYSNRSLYDLQTGDLLAFAKTEMGKQAGIVFGRHPADDTDFGDANEYIDKVMQEDR